MSRLVVDVERFEDDSAEPMSACGMGVVYKRMSDDRPLRRPISEAEWQGLIDDWYRPHHEGLAAAVQRVIDLHDEALLVDLHSFPSVPLPYEVDQRAGRPGICIGTDAFHTPARLEAAFVAAFRAGGFDVRLNAPFAGALVPVSHYRIDRRVSAVMIEVNRALYAQESSGEKNGDLDEVAARIRRCISDALGAWRHAAPAASAGAPEPGGTW